MIAHIIPCVGNQNSYYADVDTVGPITALCL